MWIRDRVKVVAADSLAPVWCQEIRNHRNVLSRLVHTRSLYAHVTWASWRLKSITSNSTVCSTTCSGRKRQRPPYWPFVRGFHPLSMAGEFSPQRPVMQKAIPCHHAFIFNVVYVMRLDTLQKIKYGRLADDVKMFYHGSLYVFFYLFLGMTGQIILSDYWNVLRHWLLFFWNTCTIGWS